MIFSGSLKLAIMISDNLIDKATSTKVKFEVEKVPTNNYGTEFFLSIDLLTI